MQTGETSKNVEAYQAIKQLIVDQKLFPGQKLIYRDLEEILGMSKTPIINSLMRLEQEGLVVSKKNRGFYMKEVSLEEAEQIFDLREKLEMISVEYATANHGTDDLRVLERAVEEYRNYEAPIYDRKRMELDTAIHMQIALMGKNQFFSSMIKTFYENIYFSLNVVHLTYRIDGFKDEHLMLCEALKAKDLARAKEIIGEHTRAARKLLTAALGA